MMILINHKNFTCMCVCLFGRNILYYSSSLYKILALPIIAKVVSQSLEYSLTISHFFLRKDITA